MQISKKLLENRRVLESIVSLREEHTSRDEKFKFLLSRDVINLIQPSYDEKSENNSERKVFRKKLNQLFKNKALSLLNTENFINNVMNLADASGLSKVKYIIFPHDFYEYSSSPAINAWESRMILLSLLFWQTETQFKRKSFADVYLPPKFEQKALTLMENYGLEFFWYESIVHLLLTGILYLPRNSSVIHLRLYKNKSIERTPTIFLEVSSLTSKEEICNRWEEMIVLQKKVFPSLKKRTKLRNIEESYIHKFNNDMWNWAEFKKIQKTQD